jgi:PHP family Zn ribbon phosphoesterase
LGFLPELLNSGIITAGKSQEMLFKIDLHIHTPASSCYSGNVISDSGLITTPQDIVQEAKRRGLDAIAITDHNTIKAVPFVKEVAQKAGLHVFPGVEISARGGHVVGLWNCDAPLNQIQDLLSSLGFDGISEGQGYCETELLIDRVFDRIYRSGGLAIAAHIDRRPKGFMVSEELSLSDKLRIYRHSHLNALEITIGEDKESWNRGKGVFQPGMACIQGSDAHALEEIARRFIIADLPDLTLSSLSLAFKEFNSRIFFPSHVTQNR